MHAFRAASIVTDRKLQLLRVFVYDAISANSFVFTTVVVLNRAGVTAPADVSVGYALNMETTVACTTAMYSSADLCEQLGIESDVIARDVRIREYIMYNNSRAKHTRNMHNNAELVTPKRCR